LGRGIACVTYVALDDLGLPIFTLITFFQ
jgi:hypothetical protein